MNNSQIKEMANAYYSQQCEYGDSDMDIADCAMDATWYDDEPRYFTVEEAIAEFRDDFMAGYNGESIGDRDDGAKAVFDYGAEIAEVHADDAVKRPIYEAAVKAESIMDDMYDRYEGDDRMIDAIMKASGYVDEVMSDNKPYMA